MSLKKRVKIFDSNFAHAKYSSDFQESEFIEWFRGGVSPEDELTFLTDTSLPLVRRVNGKKVGWLMEPRAIFPNNYQWMKENYQLFDVVLTYDKELIELGDNVHFSPHCGCWIKPEDQQVYPKSKLLSIVASNKRQTIGHRLRHEIINNCQSKNIDLSLYGRTYNPIDYKLVAMKDFMYSIVIENSRQDYYFTEKLMDAFTTGTVPVYWGCPSIGDFFNLDGMIIIENIEDFDSVANTLTKERYDTMKGAIEDNFNRAKDFLLAEDWIYKNTEIFK